jgi:hypothetical protein
LQSTIAELHRGVDHLMQARPTLRVALLAEDVIDATYEEFKAGRVHEGRMMCHRIEDLIGETRP